MKKSLLALSLIGATGLSAECCSPCIDCECYTPAFHQLDCDWGTFIDVEFLYWYARETNLPYAAVITAQRVAPEIDRLIYATDSYERLKTRWDPGARIGIGWNDSCDGWDLFLHWTYFHSTKRNSTSVPADFGQEELFEPLENEQAIINPYVNPSYLFSSLPSGQRTYNKVRASWKLNFNAIDLELGRKYWLSRCFTLRPFSGVRVAWTRTNFKTRSIREVEPIVMEQASFLEIDQDRFLNHVWGAGFLLGLQPTWYFCQSFALFGNLDLALLWGKVKAKKNEQYNAAVGEDPSMVITDFDNQYSDRFSTMHPILDLAIGLRFEDCFCCNRYRFALDLGWEHHTWFDHSHRVLALDGQRSAPTATPETTSYASFFEPNGNLVYGGLVVRGRFDF
ncbi:MAG: hypothetical protein KR126chlam1_00152 [Chlamydiae bacterium]|nr:hypothetical protein [Chlamydiota bacterium]